MVKKLKKLPKFKSEDEEREFWASHDTSDYIDLSKAEVIHEKNAFPNLKLSEDEGSEKKVENDSFDFDRASKILFITAAILYGLGLLITNSYLSQFDATEFALLKPRFIATGILAIIPMIVLIIGSLIITGVKTIHRLDENLSSGSSLFDNTLFILFVGKKIWRILLLLFFHSLVFCSLTILPMFNNYIFTFSWKMLWQGFSLYIWSATLGGGALNLFARKRFILPTSIFAPLSLILYFTYFALSYYPIIPASLGGGRPTVIIILCDSNNSKLFQSMGITFNNNMSSPVKLLFETEDKLLIKYINFQDSLREHIVQLERKSIVAYEIIPSTSDRLRILRSEIEKQDQILRKIFPIIEKHIDSIGKKQTSLDSLTISLEILYALNPQTKREIKYFKSTLDSLKEMWNDIEADISRMRYNLDSLVKIERKHFDTTKFLFPSYWETYER